MLQIAKIGFLLLLAVAAFFAARHWQAGGSSFSTPAGVEPCHLENGNCTLQVEGQRVMFAIEPPGIPLMQTLALTVLVSGDEPADVTVEIVGLNMEMGLNRTRLDLAPDGNWRGETILPICSQRMMEWEARVLLDGRQSWSLPFRFETRR
jgi:hypothetical protein